MIKVGFLGTGNMGGALAKAVSKTNKYEILLFDTDSAKANALAEEIGAEAAGFDELLKSSDYLFLGVKPQVLKSVAEKISEFKKENSGKINIYVSMAAGVKIENLHKMLGKTGPVIRIMPNTPVSIGEGIVQYCADSFVKDEELKEFTEILSKAGRLIAIKEEMIDAGCAVAGCGPAFVDMFISALADGGVACGLPRDISLTLAEQTVKGAAAYALETGQHPEKLKDDVCSPAGSTIEGVKVLEDNSFRGAVIDAVSASFKRTAELGK